MDEQLKEALKRLSNNSDFQRYLAHLTARKDEAVALGMRETDPPSIYRYQGAFNSLEAQLNDVKRIHDVRPPIRPRPIV